MAKSKVGGTRAYIRGRIGADVYSIGKDGKGSRQQVVRSLAEQVSNPRTESQMFGRMVMSTVMQAVSALQAVIDHSFDGLPKGQPSISEFIRLNYALIKADAIAHPASDNVFGLNKYQEKGAKGGQFVVSNGTMAVPSAVSALSNMMGIALTAQTLTVGGLKAALGLSADGYLTFVGILPSGSGLFVRAHVDTTLADETAITSVNVSSIIKLEGNVAATVTVENNEIVISPSIADELISFGVIVSDSIDGVWKHNKCVLKIEGTLSWTYDVALPTYPTGAQQFLNGGDL